MPDERPPCHVWADGVSCCSVITVTGGIQSPKEGRRGVGGGGWVADRWPNSRLVYFCI